MFVKGKTSKQNIAPRILRQFERVQIPNSIIIRNIPETGMDALRRHLWEVGVLLPSLMRPIYKLPVFLTPKFHTELKTVWYRILSWDSLIYKVTLMFWDSMLYSVVQCYLCLRGNYFLKFDGIKIFVFLVSLIVLPWRWKQIFLPKSGEVVTKSSPPSHRHEHLKSHTLKSTLHHVFNIFVLLSTAKSSNSPHFKL
jgi:hypothetical protein